MAKTKYRPTDFGNFMSETWPSLADKEVRKIVLAENKRPILHLVRTTGRPWVTQKFKEGITENLSVISISKKSVLVLPAHDESVGLEFSTLEVVPEIIRRNPLEAVGGLQPWFHMLGATHPVGLHCPRCGSAGATYHVSNWVSAGKEKWACVRCPEIINFCTEAMQ